MGVCLCKEKVNHNNDNDDDDYTRNNHIIAISTGVINSGQQQCLNNENYNITASGTTTTTLRKFILAEQIDQLVEETLDLIGTIVENQPEPPASMVQLHDITDKPSGWIQLVDSLMRTVPIEHPMGPSVITLLLDDSPLPSKETVLEVANKITHHSLRRSSKIERNLCVILSCLAEKQAGPSSIAVLSDTTLDYLLGNLNEGINPDVMLFSLVALEKFGQTSENKATIKRRLKEKKSNLLVRLENYTDSTDYTLRQVGFCARWLLDNYFIIEGRSYSYEIVDLSNINAMLNTKDVSEYLKISPDGLEARCDAYSFESVRCTYQITSGCWYYEVLIITPGVMQIGWATKDSNFLSHEGYGIGDDEYSIAFDGCRKLIWHNAKSISYNLPSWKGGSIVGCLLDLNNNEIIFSLNGIDGCILKQIFGNKMDGYFAAASFMSFQQCRFNFGHEPFKYPPKKRPYKKFNQFAVLTSQDKVVLPRHLFLEQLRKLSVREDSCTLCFDRKASVQLEPCKHNGFCNKCAIQLHYCPLCRAEIVITVQAILDSALG